MSFHNHHIIGIDHGYGNIKTANCCFKTGVTAYDRKPTFQNDMLEYDGRYYIIGEEHKEFAADKIQDNDYYILTLAAIAHELHLRRSYSASVHLAVGLPLTWVGLQKEAFQEYLLQNKQADFIFRDVEYHVTFTGADVFPQGFAAIVDKLQDFKGINMLADIGNGTMNIMYINDGKPQAKKCFTEKFGTHQCTLLARENLLKQFGTPVDDYLIDQVIRFGTAEVSEKYVTAIRQTATEYVQDIFRKLREHEYDPDLVRLHVVGGGCCLVKNFGEYDAQRVSIVEDICATAKGYEYLTGHRLQRNGGVA